MAVTGNHLKMPGSGNDVVRIVRSTHIIWTTVNDSLNYQQINKAHSFPWQILRNSANQFTKFHGLPQQNRSTSAGHHHHPFVNKPSSVLCINFSYCMLALCSVMPATFKENYQSFF